MKNKSTLLVTGGAGFIGSNFILYWLKNHPADMVINLDKLTYAGNQENLKTVASIPNYKFVKGDICDNDLVNILTQDTDYIVHFAAESHVDRSINAPAEFIRTNIVGTQVLLEAALKNKVRHFHHISTDEVYGSLDLNSTDKFSEGTAYNPRSPYSASKAASDHLVRAYYHTYKLPVTISNCSNNYGPYQFPEKLIPLSITNLLEDKKILVYGDGKNIRDWLYVEDHCRGIESVLTRGKFGQTYCFGGGGKELSNLDVIQKIVYLLKKDSTFIEYVSDRKGHDRKYAIDFRKAHMDLGWQPSHNFDEWLEKTVVWYQDNISWWKKLKDKTYYVYYQRQYKNK